MSGPNAEYVRLAHEARDILGAYIDDVARLDPQGEASDGLYAAYDWLVRYDLAENDGSVEP